MSEVSVQEWITGNEELEAELRASLVPDEAPRGQPIDSLREQHNKMIDWMLAHYAGKGDLARMADAFGYSYCYMSQLINSDMFKAELARRREMVNQVFSTKVIEKTYENASKSAKLLGEYLDSVSVEDDEFDPRVFMDINDRTMKQLGYAPNKPVNLVVDNSTHTTQIAVVASEAQAARERIMNKARNGTTIDGEVPASNG